MTALTLVSDVTSFSKDIDPYLKPALCFSRNTFPLFTQENNGMPGTMVLFNSVYPPELA